MEIERNLKNYVKISRIDEELLGIIQASLEQWIDNPTDHYSHEQAEQLEEIINFGKSIEQEHYDPTKF